MISERMICGVAIAAILNSIDDRELAKATERKLWHHCNVSGISGREHLTDLQINSHPILSLYPMDDRWWVRTI